MAIPLVTLVTEGTADATVLRQQSAVNLYYQIAFIATHLSAPRRPGTPWETGRRLSNAPWHEASPCGSADYQYEMPDFLFQSGSNWSSK
jgi:hypothetical protein